MSDPVLIATIVAVSAIWQGMITAGVAVFLAWRQEVTKKSAEKADFKYVRTEGYVYKEQREGTVPLLLYWSPNRNDYFTTSTQVGKQSAEEAGYRLIRTEGYVFPAR